MSVYFLEATAFASLFVQDPGTSTVLRLMGSVEDNRKLIAASTPLEVYAALLRQERAGGLAPADGEAARGILRTEATRMVQQPLSPAVLECARQLLDRHALRSSEALQLASAIVARELFQGSEIVFVSALRHLLEAARGERFETLDPTDRGSDAAF